MADSKVSLTELPTLRVGATAAKTVPPEVAQRLSPGAVLEVTIQRNADTPHGILIDGTFVAAAIPPDLGDASEVSVQVVRTAPAIILRVVSLDPTPLPTRPSTLLDEAFRILLSGDDLTTLRESFRGLERSVGESLKDLTTTITSNQTASNSLQEIARRLTESREALRVLDEDVLKVPEKVREALERILSDKRSGADVATGNRVGREPKIFDLEAAVVEAREIPLAQKTVERLRTEISRLLALPEPLTFGDSDGTDTLMAGSTKDLVATARTIAIAGGRSQSFADVVPRGGALAQSTAPIVVFLRALGALGLELSRGDSPLQREVAGSIRSLTQALNRIPPGASENSEIRAALSHGLQQLDTVAARIRDQNAEATLLVTSADITREIERVHEGQELLRALAPIARSLGEPIAMFIPAVVHGLLTKFEFTFYPPPRIEDPEDSGGKSEGDFFERIDLKLPLPSLGAVHVAVARRPGEALINLTCETTTARTHLEQFMPKLEEVLARLGYERRTVTASVGEVSSVVPEWCRTIARSERIA